jgi:hypothetical protein
MENDGIEIDEESYTFNPQMIENSELKNLTILNGSKRSNTFTYCLLQALS